MRLRIGIVCLLAFAAASFAALSLLHGEERLSAPPAGPRRPPSLRTTRPASLHRRPRRRATSPNYTDLQKDMLLSAQRGADVALPHEHRQGPLRPRTDPALPDAVPEGDSYLRQAGAAFALARSARFLGEDRYTARAAQAVLALLDGTVLAPPTLPLPPEGEGRVGEQVRSTIPPSSVVNRLGAAGLLVLAINELPDPQPDLLDAVRATVQLHPPTGPAGRFADLHRRRRRRQAGRRGGDAINYYPGLALYALMRSQSPRPAAWKTDLVRKAVAYYRPWWQAHKNMAFVPWQTAACCGGLPADEGNSRSPTSSSR